MSAPHRVQARRAVALTDDLGSGAIKASYRVPDAAVAALRAGADMVEIAAPGDRIVVVYGSGHSFLLRRCVTDLPGWELVEAIDFLPK